VTEPETLYCYLHPKRPTTLRCNRCERPICAEDAVLTPTGYLTAFFSAAIGSGIASWLVVLISGFFFGIGVLLLAPAAGAVIGNLVLRVIGHRRSRPLFTTAAGGMIAGALPALLITGIPLLLSGFHGLGAVLPAVWEIVYLFMAVPAAYTQISGLKIGG
jgi:hypothetical protein